LGSKTTLFFLGIISLFTLNSCGIIYVTAYLTADKISNIKEKKFASANSLFLENGYYFYKVNQTEASIFATLKQEFSTEIPQATKSIGYYSNSLESNNYVFLSLPKNKFAVCFVKDSLVVVPTVLVPQEKILAYPKMYDMNGLSLDEYNKTLVAVDSVDKKYSERGYTVLNDKRLVDTSLRYIEFSKNAPIASKYFNSVQDVDTVLYNISPSFFMYKDKFYGQKDLRVLSPPINNKYNKEGSYLKNEKLRLKRNLDTKLSKVF